MILQSEFPEKFDAILSIAPKEVDPEAYDNYIKLPGIWVYWWHVDCTFLLLGYKSVHHSKSIRAVRVLDEAQNGLMFAGF